jgi:adenosylcobinamide kinase/adenosylcobinamide-phosphate guanylyltransferase
VSQPVPDRADLPAITLVLGGARSGKSRHAEALVLASGLEPVYLATAEALDDEMVARIACHRARREPAWRTVEAPLDLAAGLEREAASDRAVLVDCLTLWLSNLLRAERDVAAETVALTATLGRLAGPVVLVSNEVGQGIVPANPLARRFVDEAGRLHQAIAARADRVVLMVAGLPHVLKSERACTS